MPAAENENQRHLLYGVPWFQERRLGRDEFTCVNRDAAGIYISMPRRTRKGSSMVGVEDARRLHGEYVTKGVKSSALVRNDPLVFK